MSYLIKVLVQLPDGTFQRLPLATRTDDGIKLVRQPTKKEARGWAEFVLPERIVLEEDQS